MPSAANGSLTPLTDRMTSLAAAWSHSQRELVHLAVDLADSQEWVHAGYPSPARLIAAVADVEECTAREWIRVGRCLARLPLTAAAFGDGRLSYSKVRTLTRVAGPSNEAELLVIATEVPAGHLGRALAAWIGRNSDPDELVAHHDRRRSITVRDEPDGMSTFTCRLPPVVAGRFRAALDAEVVRRRPGRVNGRHASADAWPSLAQQRVDALDALLTGGGMGGVGTEIVIHVRGDGCALDDGSPVPDSVVPWLAPSSFIRALIHDAEGLPINASSRQRHPTVRQKRVVRERDRACADCGSNQLLEYDHDPPYEESGRTVVEELTLRCWTCHHRRHRPWERG